MDIIRSVKQNIEDTFRTDDSAGRAIVAVFGATGSQGHSVVEALLDNGLFTIRGLTRDVDSEKSRALTEKGVHMVKCDITKVEEIQNALRGAYAAVVITNYWDPSVGKKEEEYGKAIMDIAKEAGIVHVLYSTLPDSSKISEGKFENEHFTMKAHVGYYAHSLGFEYTTFFEPAFYYSNWFTFFAPKKDEHGTLVWTMPILENPWSQFDVDDTGRSVVAALLSPKEYNKKHILLEGDNLTVEDFISTFQEVTGITARVNYVNDKEAKTSFYPGILEMLRWFEEFGYYGPETKDRKRSSGRAADPNMKTLRQWLDTREYTKFLH
jgi:uncharacterized protein YbjT (DUF2867 family)